MNNNLNVFKYGWEKGIINRIKLFFRRIKWAVQRATRGYCDYDVWDCTTFYTQLISATLQKLANDTNSYPDDMEFEDWQNTLRRIAFCLEEISCDKESQSEEFQRFCELVHAKQTVKTENGVVTLSFPDDDEELNKAKEAWQKVAKTAQVEREQLKQEAFELLSKYWYHLWW